jgi:hypothetical protein
MQPLFKDEAVDEQRPSPNIRIGRFIWMDDLSKKRYLSVLKDKIASGYFFSDVTISKVVDDIAPVFSEQINDR